MHLHRALRPAEELFLLVLRFNKLKFFLLIFRMKILEIGAGELGLNIETGILCLEVLEPDLSFLEYFEKNRK